MLGGGAKLRSPQQCRRHPHPDSGSNRVKAKRARNVRLRVIIGRSVSSRAVRGRGKVDAGGSLREPHTAAVTHDIRM